MIERCLYTLLSFFSLTLFTYAQDFEPAWETAPTLTEASKYAQNFRHYDYVNPQAPKGGNLNRVIIGSFDSFNPFIVQGRPPAPVLTRFGGLIYQTLLDQSLDEGGVSHGAIAQAIRSPPDHGWVEIRLDPRARWHDGVPIGVEDVIWSFETLVRISPFYRAYYRDIERAEISAPDKVKFIFTVQGNRELPKIIGDLVILPKHWWEGKSADGQKRDIERPMLEIPLGSGPYEIEKFEVGKSITVKRVEQAWGRELPQNIGRYNFDRLTYSFLLDNNAEWESFKKGNLQDWRIENNIQRWIESYNFPAFNEGRVKKLSFPSFSGLYQAYYMNLRREKFKDIRVRKALTLALDFEKINRTLYFGLYERINSYYGDQIIAARALPQGRELAILQQLRREMPYNVPDELFTQIFTLPQTQSPRDERDFLSEAMALLGEAGWRIEGGRLVDKQGDPFEIELLLQSPTLERAAFFYLHNLRRLGITLRLRTVDNSQYINRVNHFDFDMIVGLIGQSTSPGNEQMDFFGSHAADEIGSRNYAGIKNPAIDWLIEHLIQAQTRDEVIATTRALDRLLLWNYYSIPNWSPRKTNIAYWDKFGFPEHQPLYSGVDLYSWWILTE